MSEKKDIGYILLDRKLLTHWVYKDKPFNMAMAWIDLLLIATHTTHTELWRSVPTQFNRGDVNLSIKDLAARWGWSRDKARRFLKHLEADNMVRIKSTPRRTVITIVNYEVFQGRRTTDKATDKTTDKATGKTPGKTPNKTTDKAYLNNEINNDEEMKKEYPSPPPPDGERFWAHKYFDWGGDPPAGWTWDDEYDWRRNHHRVNRMNYANRIMIPEPEEDDNE